jgi:hypothetical protein
MFGTYVPSEEIRCPCCETVLTGPNERHVGGNHSDRRRTVFRTPLSGATCRSARGRRSGRTDRLRRVYREGLIRTGCQWHLDNLHDAVAGAEWTIEDLSGDHRRISGTWEIQRSTRQAPLHVVPADGGRLRLLVRTAPNLSLGFGKKGDTRSRRKLPITLLPRSTEQR